MQVLGKEHNMGKFDAATRGQGGTALLESPVKAGALDTVTHEGAPAFSRESKGDLFLLAVTNMVGEDTFYESASERDSRFRDLVHAVTAEDPGWVQRFIPWLRNEANMRSASIVAAVEYWRAGGPTPRRVVDSACQRPDEPAEILAYAKSRGYKISGGLKRGVADAVVRLYNERSSLKYDGLSRGWRMGDVIDFVHPSPSTRWQSDLYRYLLDKRHQREDLVIPESLEVLRQNAFLQSIPVDLRRNVRSDELAAAGMTWESLSGYLQGPMDAAAWESIIPSMGYMALLRNLRNFDEAGVSDKVANQVMARLADPEQVMRSRQFPFRFLSAYKAAPSLRWGQALEKALGFSMANLPAFEGPSLVLIDTSGSMTGMFMSKQGTVTPLMAGAVMGVSLAVRNGDADLYGFATGEFEHRIKKGASALKEIERFVNRSGEVGHGTDIAGAIRRTFRPGYHKRIILVTDGQTQTGTVALNAKTPLYGFNLGGYGSTVIASGKSNRHEFGGLNDKTFQMIDLLERHKSAGWPF